MQRTQARNKGRYNFQRLTPLARFQLLMAPQPLKKRFTSWGPSTQSISLWRMFQIQTITGSGEYTRAACSIAHLLPVKSALWTEMDSQL